MELENTQNSDKISEAGFYEELKKTDKKSLRARQLCQNEGKGKLSEILKQN